MEKLIQISKPTYLISLVDSFLHGRHIEMEISGEYYTKDGSFGILQVSSLSPLLFIILIDGLLKINLFGKPQPFAHDCNMIYEQLRQRTEFVAKQNILSNLQAVWQWCLVHKLSLNAIPKHMLSS